MRYLRLTSLGSYPVRAPLTPLLFARYPRGERREETRKDGENLNYGRKWA